MSAEDNVAHVTRTSSTALDGVGANPLGEDNAAHVSQKGSTALDGVGANPVPLDESAEKTQSPTSVSPTTVKDTVSAAIGKTIEVVKSPQQADAQIDNGPKIEKPRFQNVGLG
ncbi:5059_t:CDS:2 [Dentiscutata erythropus]|uniref:5059_t:CDS:1 n=1 Tax=Dentiscutata erythropus TaxID=1348616 RepID=A0A9N8Z7J7_9GLOM|nr:5059_t:CDS:2 [Dentiscutata erythropus]